VTYISHDHDSSGATPPSTEAVSSSNSSSVHISDVGDGVNVVVRAGGSDMMKVGKVS